MSHAVSCSGQSDDLVITLGTHSAAALDLGDLLGHPVGPGVVEVVVVGLVVAVVGFLRDLHSLEIFLYLTRSKLAMTEGRELNSAAFPTRCIAAGSLPKSPASHSSSFAGMCSSSVYLALCRILS